MNKKPRIIPIIYGIAGLLGMSIILAACSGTSGTAQTQMPPAVTPTSQPTLTLEETSTKDFTISDFGAVHAQVEGDANKFLIFGNLQVAKPAADLPPELAPFLGRWEGYDFAPPIKKDRKVVFVVQEISSQGGTAYGWSATNLQYPDVVGEFHYRIIQGDAPSIEWQIIWPDGSKQIASFTYDRQKDQLSGGIRDLANNMTDGPYELTRDKSFYVYKDYPKYLENKGIYTKTYQNSQLQRFGKGYMVYLPEDYQQNSDKDWPLLFFLHGAGDRGDNVFLLAKASPFMYIREKGAQPFIIAAPILNKNQSYSSFPDEYLDGVLEEIRAEYRVDAKRIYLTGLSMGGEATWRFALHQPDTFAAVAPLCAFLDQSNLPLVKNIKDVPVWAIHGSNDTVIRPSWGQQPVDALKNAGGNVRFTILPDHDHDVWTDTYSDPAFYEWFLQYQKQ
jgi:dienelactone hydrolase